MTMYTGSYKKIPRRKGVMNRKTMLKSTASLAEE